MSADRKNHSKSFKSLIRDVVDFPKKGIIFKDITPLLKDADAFRRVCDDLSAHFNGMKVDQVVGVESRGFILAPAIAYRLGAGFVPIRKKGKLPSLTCRVNYQLEYGEDTLEIHVDAIQKGTRVVVIDDLLATGGTAEASARLVEQLGGEVLGLAFLVELAFLKGRQRLTKYPVHSLVSFS